MGAISTTACVVAGVIGFGILAGGGPVHRPDGTVDLGATVQRGAGVGGAELGDAVGKTTDGLGTGLADGVTNALGASELARAAAAGAGGYGAYRLWQWNNGRDKDEVGGGPSDDEAPPTEEEPPVEPEGDVPVLDTDDGESVPVIGGDVGVSVPPGLILPPGVDLGKPAATVLDDWSKPLVPGSNFDDWSWRGGTCTVGGVGVTWMSAC